MHRDGTFLRKLLIMIVVILLCSIVLLAFEQPDKRLLKTVTLSSVCRLADVASNGRVIAFAGELDTRSDESPLSFSRMDEGTGSPGTKYFPIYAIRFSPDGNLLAMAGQDGVRLVITEDGSVARLLKGDQVFALAFSEHGDLLATGSADGKVRIWNTNGELIEVFNVRDRITSLDFGPNDTMAIGCSAQTGLVRQSDLPKSPFPIVLWQRGQTKELSRFPAHQIATTSLRFSPDGLQFVSGGPDGLVKAWKMGSTEPLWVYKMPASLMGVLGARQRVNDISFSKDGRYLAIASESSRILVLQASDGKVLTELSGHRGEVIKVTFVTSGELMSVGEDRTVRIWRDAAW
jgi:WD40 repeat protein